MFENLAAFEKRYEELNRELCEPAVASDPKRYTEFMKELKSVEPIVEKYREYRRAGESEAEAKAILGEGGTDRELRQMAEDELSSARGDLARIAGELNVLLLPHDPNDARNVIFEIRAGGQHINKTSSAIRVTHLPTGMVVECQDERSQYKNKDRALKILRSRLFDRKQKEQDDKVAAERRSQVGTGDRSERIRTYNYPQGRVTDHRIGLTLYRLEEVLNGDIDEIIEALTAADRAEKLKDSNR